jgi:hypothetical protein
MTVIGSVIWQPPQPVPGESVKVDVCGPDGQPYDNAQPELIAINGVVGSSQYLQFPVAGPQQIVVVAVDSDGALEQYSGTMTVAPTQPSASAEAFIGENPYLTADQISWIRATADVSMLTVTPPAPGDPPYKVTFALTPVRKWLSPPQSESPDPLSNLLPSAQLAMATLIPEQAVAVRIGTEPDRSRAFARAPETARKPPYEWQFGDGSVGHSDEPTISHDYGPALNSTDEFQFFTVTLSFVQLGAGDQTETSAWTRTLSVHNTYVACKKRGYVVPPVAVAGWADKLGETFTGTAVISNREAVPLTLRSRLLIPRLEDSSVVTLPTPLEPLHDLIVVPPLGAVTVQVTAPFDLIPADAVGFSAVFADEAVAQDGEGSDRLPPVTVLPVAWGAGTRRRLRSDDVRPVPPGPAGPVGPTGPVNAPGGDPIAGLRVRATAHFLVAPQYRGNSAEMVGQINVTDLLRDPARIRALVGDHPAGLDSPNGGDLAILGLDPASRPVRRKGPPHRAGGGQSSVAAGHSCDPNNLPADVPGDLACQATNQSETVTTEAQFLNARKGDIILCPSVGGQSLIDGMFDLLSPPQLYGHTGIMSANYDRITHCTAGQGRLTSYGVGLAGSGGLQPDALKYAWPGVITQSVDQAVNGQLLTDPASASGQQYTFQDFWQTSTDIQIDGQWTIIPPIVVKPDPLLENFQVRTGVTVRELLGQVADDAYDATGKFHYRFYCFTDPLAAVNGGLAAPASGLDPSSTWAAGTNAAVCASFIWMMMKKNLVNALGPDQNATTAELSSYASGPPPAGLDVQIQPGQTPDGLFFYSESVRTNCATWLWNQVHQIAANTAGWAGELLTDAGWYYATQFCNVFADDDASVPSQSASSQPWQDPGNSNAISPENFLAWNGPPTQGCVLGYFEAADFRPKTETVVPVYKWAKITQYGKISGRVDLAGQPQRNVTVQTAGPHGPLTTGTDHEGRYSFGHLPYGHYVVTASFSVTSGAGTTDGTPTGFSELLTGQKSVDLQQADATADITLAPPDTPYDRTVQISGHLSLDCSTFGDTPKHATAFAEFAYQLDIGVKQPAGAWSQTFVSRTATAQLSLMATYNADYSVDVGGLITLDLNSLAVAASSTTDPQSGTTSFFPFKIPAGGSLVFTVGNASSFLNGANGWTYDGCPDLEDDNDTLCCMIQIVNGQWSGG